MVVHPTRNGYLKAVGAGGGQTAGASYIQVRAGAIAVRRIDLYGGQKGCETVALPHELTHVVFAGRFHDQPVPLWADEGAAILADPAEKQRLHRRDLDAALASGTAFEIGCLFSVDCCPSNAQCGVFYGQSLSVADFLVRRAGPQRFVAFVSQAMRTGYDRALDESYGIRGVAELDRLWRQYALAGRPTAVILPDSRPQPESNPSPRGHRS